MSYKIIGTVGWEQLDPEQKKSLLRNIFEDPEWFPLIEWIVDDGYGNTPLFRRVYGLQMSHYQLIGTLGNIAGRLNAPIMEIRRYFAAWCENRQIWRWKELLGIGNSKWSFSTMEEDIPLEEA